jgi:hypothetical protein
MTPQQIEESIRRRYNAVSSSFWSQDEIFKIMYEAEMTMAIEDLVIEAKDTSTSTVIGTRIYNYPSLVIGIKRIEYNGLKLQPIDFREDDALTFQDATSTLTGLPQYYAIWNKQIYLRPTPDAVQTLTIYAYKEPTLLTTASTTMSAPTICHPAIINYGASFMAMKDQNLNMFDRYQQLWESDRIKIRQWFLRKKRTDGYAVVKDEESLPITLLGSI